MNVPRWYGSARGNLAGGITVDAAADVLAGLDFEPCCHWDNPECETPATWVGVWPCCGARLLMCDEHRLIAIETLKETPLKHLRCRAVVDHMLWLSLPRGGGRG